MFPVIFEIGGSKIHSYGFFISIGYVSALLLGRYLAKARSLEPGPFMDIAFVAIITGVIGARLLYVITSLDYFSDHPGEALNFWNGGLVFYGGFIFASLSCLAYGYFRKMPILLSTDIVFAGVAFAHAFGRIGCFAAGCCHGSVCHLPWAIENHSSFVGESLRGHPLHPVQLYESAMLFALTAVLAYVIRGRKMRDGNPALLYLIGYAAIRFATEFFRGDLERGFVLGGLFSTSQAIALALFMIGSAFFIIRRLDSRPKGEAY